MATAAPVRYPHHRFSTVDYHRMAEAGILRPNSRVELLDGAIIEKPRTTPLEASRVSCLWEVLLRALDGRACVRTRAPNVLNEYSEPEPDVSVVQDRDDEYWHAHPRSGDALLLVEVAESTVELDRQLKLPLYADTGVPEFWLIDLVEKVFEVYRQPSGGEYRTRAMLPGDGFASPLAFQDVRIDVARFVM